MTRFFAAREDLEDRYKESGNSLVKKLKNVNSVTKALKEKLKKS